MVVLDSAGKERARIEGYLPNADFRAALENALGRVALFKKDYVEAERWFDDVLARFSKTDAAPEAVYWRGVAQYRRTNDHHTLSRVADELNRSYPDSVWAKKAIPWGPAPQKEVAD